MVSALTTYSWIVQSGWKSFNQKYAEVGRHGSVCVLGVVVPLTYVEQYPVTSKYPRVAELSRRVLKRVYTSWILACPNGPFAAIMAVVL